MKRYWTSTNSLTGGTIARNHTATAQVRDAASDPRINHKVRTFLRDLDKDRIPFWELPQHKLQDRVAGLQNKTLADISGVSASERTITQKGRTVREEHHGIALGQADLRERQTRRTRVALVDGPSERHDTEPTFLAAIAGELAKLHGGTARQHSSLAKDLLEKVFRNVEREERSVQWRRAVHAA